MMCSCDEEFARKYLPHQISEGTELETQRRVPVTLGFQRSICDKCRGIPQKAYPKSATYGRGSKVHRYYWREIAFETIKRFAEWAENQGFTDWLEAMLEHREIYNSIEREVVNEIKEMHQTCPKYVYQEESQAEILSRYNVEILDLNGTYVSTPGRYVSILDGNMICTAEEFVERYFKRQGYNVLRTESVPFHVIFGVFMWLLIQDPADELGRFASFGERSAFEQGTQGELITTILPKDFGSSGYFQRRKEAVETHLNSIPEDKDELLWTFDYWIDGSHELRQYLWAHRPEDVDKAREIIRILPPSVIKRILDYLIQNYWQRYLGWPDLLVFDQNEFFFVEVKSSKDKLREDQKTWIGENAQHLNLPFKMVKIHKRDELTLTGSSNNINNDA